MCFPEINRTDQSEIKPLEIDDAATEHFASDKGFFLFRNSESDRLNVAFRCRGRQLRLD